MEMQMCSRCHKRVAVVYITKFENGETVNEGLCLPCAKALGIKPVNDMIEKMGISDEDMERMSGEMEGAVQSLIESQNDHEDGGAPAIDFPKLFQNMGFPMMPKHSGNTPKGSGKSGKDNAKNKKQEDNRKFLKNYCRNLTELAKEGRLDRIIGRDLELERVIHVLSRRQKNNPCLIGEPGVGKTAIAEALALRIVEGRVPYRLRNAEVMLLDLTALVAGTQFRGQFESRVLGLLSEVKSAGNIILVIDEVHNLVGAGDAEGSMNAANMMKPALSRGEIQVIGATTMAEYRRHIEKDSALERRFQPIVVNEPSIEDTVKVLLGIKKYYEDYHGISIPDHLVRRIVVLSERYITDRFLPDKAIDLLDESAAKLALASPCISEKKEAEEAMRALGAEKDEATAKSEGAEANEETYKLLADIKVRELQLLEKLRVLEEECAKIQLGSEDVARVLEVWTGIPAASIDAQEYERLLGLDERISSHVIGQKEAVDAVVRAIKRKRAGVSYRKTPVSFIFAGPTGVGKTELVKVLAKDLFDRPESLIRLDMSEFMEKHAVSRIIGAPPGYVGYDDAGQLTEKIRRHPYSVVLFDEIEKAHPDVMNILLQVLDEGKITDASGRQVNFENTVIIMTTNAGADRSSAVTGFFVDERVNDAGRERTERALSEFLRPEFLNRVDEIITFRHLSMKDFVLIADLRMRELAEALEEKGITLSYDSEVLNVIAEKSYSHKFGARHMQRYLRHHIEDVLAEKLIASYTQSISRVHVSADQDELTISCL